MIPRISLSIDSRSPVPARSPLARRGTRAGPADAQARERQQRLMRLHGPGELKAALLALVLTPDSPRELQAWREEVHGVVGVAQVHEDIAALPPPARVPWFELLAARVAGHAVEQRQALARAVRRVMRADGHVRAQDRLLWLALRRQLGERPAAVHPADAHNDLSRLGAAQIEAITVFTAFLSRLVPQAEADAPAPAEPDSPGAQWHAAVMAQWARVHGERPAPDGDAMLRALRAIQALPWMLRPVLVRRWFAAAAGFAGGPALPHEAADALRLVCLLLDSPMPVDLARQFAEPQRGG